MMGTLFARLHTRYMSDVPCKKCGAKIKVGTEYFAVRYSDGYLNKLEGYYHVECCVINEK